MKALPSPTESFSEDTVTCLRGEETEWELRRMLRWLLPAGIDARWYKMTFMFIDKSRCFEWEMRMMRKIDSNLSLKWNIYFMDYEYSRWCICCLETYSLLQTLFQTFLILAILNEKFVIKDAYMQCVEIFWYGWLENLDLGNSGFGVYLRPLLFPDFLCLTYYTQLIERVLLFLILS